MAKERNEYAGPIEDEVRYAEFSKEFLLKLMAIWQDHWDAFITGLIIVGSQMEGIGAEKALELQTRTLEAVTPSTMARIAEMANCDIKTVEGRCKVGMLSMDNIEEKYRGHWEVKSDREVLLSYDRCRVFDMLRAVGDFETLHRICLEVEPRYGMAFQNYPGVSPKVKVTMLKVPQTLTPPEGEPLCVWRFAFDE
jgi:hypothetical protein